MEAGLPLAIGFATIERPQAVQRLVRSVRRHFATVPIYVADQSRDVTAMAGFYAAHDVVLLRVPYDCGVTVARNRLARAVTQPFFVLCDDDFVFGERTNFADAIRLLERRPELAVVGGRLYDYDGGSEYARKWELFLQYDRQNRILVSVPIYELAPRVLEVAGIRAYQTDTALNFAVFRTGAFAAGAGWDERFKSNGEHEDFYLNLKVNTSLRVAHLPTMVAYHHHPEIFQQYRTRLRHRSLGWRLFMEKWGIDQHLELGLGVQTLDEPGVIYDAQTTRARFFLNGDLALRRGRADPAALAVLDFAELAPVGMLDEAGTAPAGAAQGRLLVDPATRKPVPAPMPAMTPSAEETLTGRYALEAADGDEAVAATPLPLLFHYDAIWRAHADFVLWHRVDPGARVEGGSTGERLSVAVRWSADNGAQLVWKSRRLLIDLDIAPHWRPLLVEVPLPPRGCRWLRFDVVTDGTPNTAPVCTGFLFLAPGPAAADERADALALARLANDGATPGQPGLPLRRFGHDQPARRLRVRRLASTPDLAEIPLADLTDLEAVFFADCSSLGRTLVGARLPRSGADIPPRLVVPVQALLARNARIFGYGMRPGFLRLAPESPAA